MNWGDDPSIGLLPMAFAGKVMGIAITINGAEVARIEEIKYLEPILDSKFIGRNHIDHIIAKTIKALMVYKCIAGKTWCSKSGVLRWMYTMTNSRMRSGILDLKGLPCNR